MKTKFHREDVLPQVYWYFEQADSFSDLDSRKCSAHIGCTRQTLTRLVGKVEWRQMKLSWARSRLLKAMDEVYLTSTVREEFMISRVIKQAGALCIGTFPGSPICPYRFHNLVGEEWKALAATLPTIREVILSQLEEIVKTNIPFNELSCNKVVKAARFHINTFGSWLMKPLLEARTKLEQQQRAQAKVSQADPQNRPSPSVPICLSDDEWDLRSVKGVLIKRSKLRSDLADISWSILREELRAEEFAPNTVCNHHYGFVLVGQLLGTDVPDIRCATLESVQYAWCKYNGSEVMKRYARQALTQLFFYLIESPTSVESVNTKEILRILCWLNSVKLTKNKPNENFLSQAETEMVIRGCSVDIATGLAFINDHPDWSSMTTRRDAKTSAAPVLDWATALMVLLMAVTGLRSQSLLELEVDRWVQINEDMFALAYHHGKVTSEKVVGVPAVVIKSLQQYCEITNTIREKLSTKRLFLNGSGQGFWCVFKSQNALKIRLEQFIERHRIERDSTPINLTSYVMRRTYATRELIEGRSLNIVQAQLGHIYSTTTEIYVKFDRFEHPALVRNALDEYGRIALTTWKHPVILETLSPVERQAILVDKTSRHQDVGLCRHDHCIKVQQGGPPPCSLCEHLATGSEFLGAWRSEHSQRLAEIKRLSDTSSDGHLLAEKQHQLNHFKANLNFVEQQASQ